MEDRMPRLFVAADCWSVYWGQQSDAPIPFASVCRGTHVLD